VLNDTKRYIFRTIVQVILVIAYGVSIQAGDLPCLPDEVYYGIGKAEVL
jgi:hypothetical protein